MSAWIEQTDRKISAQLAAYRHEFRSSVRRDSPSDAVRCPRCGLVVASRSPSLEPRHCPRCLAHRRAAVALEPVSGCDPAALRREIVRS